MKIHSIFLLGLITLLFTPVGFVAAQGVYEPGGSGVYNPGGSGVYEPGNSGVYDPCPSGSVCLKNPLKANTFQDFFRTLMDVIFIIAMPIAVLAMGLVGAMFVLARGNSEKLTKAKQALLYTVIGIALFFGVWLLINALASLMRALGVPI